MNATLAKLLMAAPVAALVLSTPADARRHHRETYAEAKARHDADHGNCLRFNKTTGAVAGAVAGGLLGKAVLGGTGGTLLGAAGGGLAGHSLANNRRKRC